jgi:hypothetical protein
MRFASHTATALAVLTFIAVRLPAAALAQPAERKVLTIAMDGLRPDALIAASTPNIDSLLDGSFFGTAGPSGLFATYAQSEHLTFSGPGWGAYMTGLHVDRHGADTNEFENVVPGTTDWFTPLEAFDPSLDTHRVITWEICHTSIPSGADTAENFEYNQNGDQLMTNRVVQWMQNPPTDAVMMFYSDTDAAGHSFGFSPTSPQYLAEIANVDAQIGQVMSAMAARPNFANEDWLVIITTDHGGLGFGHSGGLPEQRTIPFIVAGRQATPILPQAHPRQVDVAATVLTYFGAPIPANYDGYAVGLSPAGPAAATLGQNLVFNGDAEFNRGFDSNGEQQYAAGWDNPGPGGVTTLFYGAGGGFPAPATPGPPDRGANFFSGGTDAVSTMTQRIDVTNLASRIDQGNIDAIFTAWLGGFSNQTDNARVVARFLNAAESEIGLLQLGPVTAADRSNVTSLLFRDQVGDLPALTRFVDVELIATRAPSGENDGYADNISLVLAQPGDLDLNSIVNVGDWALFRQNLHLNMAGLTPSEALAKGDMNGDFRSDHADFVLFKTAFDGANGVGSFAAMLVVPEPAALWIAVAAMLVSARLRRGLTYRSTFNSWRTVAAGKAR